MSKVTVYRTAWCPYCQRAEALLAAKNLSDLDIVDIEQTPGARARMVELAGATSVPQIFIGDRHVGGCDELHDLEHKGELDAMLAA